MNHWSTRAACKGVDPEIFFPNIHNNSVSIEAYTEPKAICATCTVQDECLDEVLEIEGGAVLRYGYRGGKTPRQRRTIASQRRKATATVGGAA